MTRRHWLALLAILLAATGGELATAQGANGQLPDPISGARLSVYADMLSLSPQQRHAIEDLHAAYREESQQLREGEIDAWLKSVRSGHYTRAYIRTQRDLLDRIAAIDNRFFDSVLPILTDEQLVAVQRVRLLRQRERLMHVQAFWHWNEAQPFDLSQAAWTLALTSAQRQAIDTPLMSYETALTAKFQAVGDNYFATFTKTFDAYDRAGITEDQLADPTRYEALRAVSTPIWNVSQAKHHEMMAGIITLNRSTLQVLSSMLPADNARSLRNAFIIATYTFRTFVDMQSLLGVTSPYDQALARDDLTDAQRTLLEPQAAEFLKEVDATVDGLIARVERYRGTFVGSFDQAEEFKERTALEQAWRDAGKSIRARAKADAERIAALIGLPPVTEPEIVDPETANLADSSYYRMVFGGMPDMSFWLPPTITAGDLALYSQWLALDGAGVEELRAAYGRHLQAFASYKQLHRPAISSASKELHKGDSIEGFTDENLRRRRAAEDAAAAAQHAIEDAFFADVEHALNLQPEHPAWQRIKLARLRQWLNLGSLNSETRQAGGRRDGLLDLSFILRRVRGLDLAAPQVDQVMLEYEQALTPLLKARQDAMIAYSRVDEELRVEWQKKRVETGEASPDMKVQNAERGLQALRKKARSAADPIAELNLATVEQLVAAMPHESAERVLRTFERLSWPSIYSDRSLAAPLLVAALKVNDLAPQQHAEIENIAAEYHPAYNAICEKMKSMVEGPDSSIYDQENSTDEQRLGFWQRENDRKRVLFDRHELNVRTWQRLKGVLTEEQSKAIGLWAVPPDPPGDFDSFGT